MNKYRYLQVIQQHFGHGWEDVSEYGRAECKELKHDAKEYRRLGYPTRIIRRREQKY
jgi:hypothetical protein